MSSRTVTLPLTLLLLAFAIASTFPKVHNDGLETACGTIVVSDASYLGSPIHVATVFTGDGSMPTFQVGPAVQPGVGCLSYPKIGSTADFIRGPLYR